MYEYIYIYIYIYIYKYIYLYLYVYVQDNTKNSSLLFFHKQLLKYIKKEIDYKSLSTNNNITYQL